MLKQKAKRWVNAGLCLFFFLLFSPLAAAESIYTTLDTPFYDANGSAACTTDSGVQSPTSTNAGLVWPFATKNDSQVSLPVHRIDQGWDIQAEAGAPIFAIAPGTIYKFNANDGGFGNDYPTEKLDSSIGGPSDWIYYGHVHVLPSVLN